MPDRSLNSLELRRNISSFKNFKLAFLCIRNFCNLIMWFESQMKRLKYDKSLNQVQRLFEEPDFAWKTKRKKNKNRPEYKVSPDFQWSEQKKTLIKFSK